jgi:hypothetical protein
VALTKITGSGLGTLTSDVDAQGSSGATLKLTSTDTTGADTELLGQIDFVSSDSSTGSAGTQARIKGVYEDNGDSTGIAFIAGASTGSGTPTISEVMRIRHEGKVGIGTSSPSNTLQVNGDGARLVNSSDTDMLHLFQFDSGGANADFYDASGTHAIGLNTSGNSFINPSTSDRGLLVGKSSSNSANAGIELKNDGFAALTRAGRPLLIRRNSDDGQLIQFNQDGTEEGGISVSGSTVSYNGGHLSRWSQATDGNRIDGLVKGTVMTNLDQMAEWTKDGVTEGNEQLNCMAVSSVEGDANVAGVFVNWDDDDEDYTADMNIAMTGDMVIRIASGTTVARGDLLMSAGDGTAKPQGDDIVRSKTIAKVTSTTKSHTYDDGSYLVPCVLMAC